MKHLLWLIALCLPQLAHAQRAPAPEPWVMTLTYEDSWSNRRDVPGGRCEEIVASAQGAQLLRREVIYGDDGWLKMRSIQRDGGVYETRYSRDKKGRITTFVEVRGDPQQTTEGKITRDPRTGRVTEITRRAEYAARGGLPASVRREVALLKRRPGGWARVMTAWLDDAVIGRETIEVEGARPRSARSVELEGRWSFEYNERGQLIAQHDADARKDYAAMYDASGRLSAERLNQSSRRIWSYDDEGLIKSLEIIEDQSGMRGVLEASWGAQRQELRCVAAPAQAGLTQRGVLWSATRRGDACGMDYDDWVALSALCIDAARTREGG